MYTQSNSVLNSILFFSSNYSMQNRISLIIESSGGIEFNKFWILSSPYIFTSFRSVISSFVSNKTACKIESPRENTSLFSGVWCATIPPYCN